MPGRSNHQITQVSVLLFSHFINSFNYCIVLTRFHFSEKPKGQDLLVIPLKGNQRTSAALASLRNLQNTLNDEEDAATENNVRNGTTQPAISATATLEERVVNELLAEARNEDVDNEDSATILTLPLNQDEPVLDGAKESSIGDYENIPIAQFGMAMLRGMGLKDEEIRAKNAKEPELRPRGMGLGADKLAKPKKLLVAPAANETLEIKKNACVRILAGKYKDLYGQVTWNYFYCGERIKCLNSLQIEGLDDHAGRVIVKMALGGAREALNEFMVQPVSKQEYAQYGKVINSAKYDEYKKKQEDAEKMKAEGRTKDSAEATSSSRRRRSASREERSRRSRSRDERGGGDSRRDSRQSDHRSSNRRNDERRHSPPKNRDKRRSRSKDRRNRSTERQPYRNDKNSSSSSQAVKYDERTKSSKYDRNRSQSSHSASSSSTSSSDSTASPRNRSSHKKHSKQKNKKSSKSHRDQSDDDRHVKKKTKKSKRQRSRSRGRY